MAAMASPEQHVMRTTFHITYVLLITTGTITLVEALRTENPTVRHVMNIETCVSLIAAFFYDRLNKRVEQGSRGGKEALGPDDYAALRITRYTDWCITTPFMLLALALVLAHHDRRQRRVTLGFFSLVLLLDYAMLAFGAMGESLGGSLAKSFGVSQEQGEQSRVKSQSKKGTYGLLGFAAFAGLCGALYVRFVRGSGSRANAVVFALFVFLWSLYGVAYYLPSDRAAVNTAYNLLDLTAKCLTGLMFWAYFTRVIVL